ncbi:ABC transporter substrate-binding protein [Ammoniphilus sp. 3BR4]|uniref:ABC transporter substrate-binding protein n=1 Tax=Ammoniphilus sp. 3BR4 TaxID=3158265 RepID=UPI00346760EB
MLNKNRRGMKNIVKGILFGSLLAATLTACGSQDSSSSAGSAGSSGSSAESSDVIRIGQIAPFSGNAASFGIWDNNGLMLVVDEVNANGGIQGKKIEVIKMDDQGNPTLAVNAAQKLVNENVSAVFATPLSTATLATINVFKEAKIPQLTAGQDPALTSKGSEYIFRYNANSRAYTKTTADYLVNKLGMKKIAIISNSGAYGKGELDSFTAALKELNVTPVASEVVAPDAKDFSAQLTNIKAANPEVLYIGSENIQSGLIVKQARALGLNAQIAGGSALDPIYIQTAGKDVAEGTIFTTQYIINANEETKAFNEAYKEKYGEEAEFHGAKAYDGAKMLVEALNKAYPNLDGESVRTALREITYKGLTGEYKFDETGEGTDRAQIGIIKNGQFEAVDY